MTHRETYKGREIIVDTHKLGKGYRWSYTIDMVEGAASRDRSLEHEEIMLREGIAAAKADVDRMDAKK
jgi:hypothetical protein